MAKLNRILSGWLNRFSSGICAESSARTAKYTGKMFESLESRRLLTASISGVVFNDADGNGDLDTGETGIANVTVYADIGDHNTFLPLTDPHTTTDVNGNYTLSGLAAGSYVIREVVPTGDVQSLPFAGAGQHVTLASTNVTGIDFGAYVQPASYTVTGTIFNDTNNDGILDNSEHGIAGVTVYVDSNNDRTLQILTEQHTTTDVNGNYSFTITTPGTYVIRQVQPTGTVQSAPANGDGDHITLAALGASNENFGDFTPDGAITEADMDVISGTAFDPTNSLTTVKVEFVWDTGVTQTILANQANHSFTYATPEMSVGAHTVKIFVINSTTNITNFLTSETVTSQNPLFNENYYDTKYPDVKAAIKAGVVTSGYQHYLLYGQFENRSPSPYWNEAFYLLENPDVAAAVRSGAVSSGFMQYYLYGQFENRPGLEYFNQSFYLQQYPDVAAAVNTHAIGAFAHYVEYGQYENRSPMKYFSAAIYDGDNQDILPFITGETFTSDFEQYVEFGQFEGRTASNFYSESFYRNRYPDVVAAINAGAFQDGLEHWLEYGQFEGRRGI